MNRKIGYFLIFNCGKELGPIANDSVDRDTYNDPRIERKVIQWASKLGIRWEYRPR